MLVAEADKRLLYAKGVVGVRLSLYEVKVLGGVTLEVRVGEDMVGAPFDLGLVEVVHVELTDEG